MDTMEVVVSDITKEIARICKEKKISRYALAKRAGIPDSTVRNMYQKGSTPNFSTLELICSGMGMTVSEFFAQSEVFPYFTEDQMELMEIYSQLDDKNRQFLLTFARGIMADHKIE